MAKSFRTTISVPADLKARMDAVGVGENWSALACRAFEQRLAEIITQRGVKDIQDVVARLRASRMEQDDETARDVIQAGRNWAKESAEAVELERLERAFESEGVDDWVAIYQNSSSAYSLGETVVGIIAPNDGGNRQAARDFWESICVEDEALSDNPAFIRGDVTEALEVWERVKNKL